jgi:glucan phosphorylase
VRIRQGNMFHMANLAVYIFFRQWVAKSHTDIIIKSCFDVTNRLCPQKFSSITPHGITQRRWLGLRTPTCSIDKRENRDGWRRIWTGCRPPWIASPVRIADS